MKDMGKKAGDFKGEKSKKKESELDGVRSTISQGKGSKVVAFEKGLMVLVKNVKFRTVERNIKSDKNV